MYGSRWKDGMDQFCTTVSQNHKLRCVEKSLLPSPLQQFHKNDTQRSLIPSAVNMAISKRNISIILGSVFLVLLSSLLLLLYSNKHWRNFTEQFQDAICVPKQSWDPDPPIYRAFHPINALEETSEPHSSLHHQTEQTWESLLLPPNGGLLRVRRENGTTGQYGVSMFHQLHCLIVLRGLLFPGTSQNHEHSTSPSKTGEPHQDSVHWAHCLDYIAQVRSILVLTKFIAGSDPILFSGNLMRRR